MATYDIIENAIRNRQQVTAIYRGRERKLCPHILGRKNGQERLFAYQFAGSSKSGLDYISGSPSNWRCMFLDELENVESKDGDWYTAENYTRTPRCIDTIYVAV